MSTNGARSISTEILQRVASVHFKIRGCTFLEHFALEVRHDKTSTVLLVCCRETKMFPSITGERQAIKGRNVGRPLKPRLLNIIEPSYLFFTAVGIVSNASSFSFLNVKNDLVLS